MLFNIDFSYFSQNDVLSPSSINFGDFCNFCYVHGCSLSCVLMLLLISSFFNKIMVTKHIKDFIILKRTTVFAPSTAMPQGESAACRLRLKPDGHTVTNIACGYSAA